MKRLLTLTFAAIALSAAPSASAQLLLNPSYEANAPGSTTATNWTTKDLGTGTTSVEIVTSPGVTDGLVAAELTVTQGDNYGTFFNQARTSSDLTTAGMVDGTTYRLSADFTLNSASPQLIQMGYTAFNSGFVNSIEDYSDLALTQGITKTVFLDFTFDPTTYSDSYVFEMRSGVFDSTDLVVSVDNWQLTAVPEPSAFALLGLGLGALLIRRRRRAQATA